MCVVSFQLNPKGRKPGGYIEGKGDINLSLLFPSSRKMFLMFRQERTHAGMTCPYKIFQGRMGSLQVALEGEVHRRLGKQTPQAHKNNAVGFSLLGYELGFILTQQGQTLFGYRYTPVNMAGSTQGGASLTSHWCRKGQ